VPHCVSEPGDAVGAQHLLDDQPRPRGDARVTRDQLIQELKKRNIEHPSGLPAISQYPIWLAPQEPQPVAKWLGDRAINLPSAFA